MPFSGISYKCEYEIRKFRGDSISEEDLYEIIYGKGNLLTYGGASNLWNRLTESSPSVTVFDDTNAHIGVGDSSTAVAGTQNDLVAATNKLRKVANVTHSDGQISGSASVSFVATFTTAEANFAWNEWGVFNHVSAGRMLNRKVESLGTKTSAATWQITVTLSFTTAT